MKIQINANTNLPSRSVQRITDRMKSFKSKFDHLLYAEINILEQGQRSQVVKYTTRLGVAGHDIILKGYGVSINDVVKHIASDAKRYLRKHKERTIESSMRAHKALSYE